ncbi:uncharacterized protein C2orf81 homolog [Limanda limanda]|uniref:uncharacterized protein C2orf81 homolog n=1 Tax=Limanda limanda TaxID=27771 RepID=UPI0029C626BC|nr:uncharacterized protein C2orf81 homolog [Limanda limanda]
MPRSVAKSQAGKSRRMSSVPVTPLPTQELEIIPGRLTKTQWNKTLIQEENDEIVGEIMDELMSKVMDGCLQVHVERQLEPFAACWAKNYLTQILEQQIMCPDEGEGPEEASKTEDSEPMSSLIDSWAQGYVPVVIATPRLSHPTSAQQEADVDQVPAQTGPADDQQCDVMAQTKSSPKQPDMETSPRKPVDNKQCKVLIPRPPPKIDVKKKQQFNFPPKPVAGILPPILSCSELKKDVEAEDKRGVYCVYNNMAGPSHQFKKYQSIPRLDSSSLPRHAIFPEYEIVDSDQEKPNPKKPSRLSKLEPKYNKQKSDWTITTVMPLTSSKNKPAKFHRRNEADVFLKKLSPFRRRQEGMKFSGSLKLDTMVLAQGVTMRDAQASATKMPKSKPKAGRSKRTPTAPVTPAPTQELESHCRLTHTQLNNILIKEERDETVKEDMDELMSKVMDGCLKVYVISQLEPFAACWAKNYLTQVLEQQIMCPDEGEGPEEASKTEDSEPMSSLIDSWAQGCVPVVIATPRLSHPISAQQVGYS